VVGLLGDAGMASGGFGYAHAIVNYIISLNNI